jgi:hypothetical protein
VAENEERSPLIAAAYSRATSPKGHIEKFVTFIAIMTPGVTDGKSAIPY